MMPPRPKTSFLRRESGQMHAAVATIAVAARTIVSASSVLRFMTRLREEAFSSRVCGGGLGG